MAQWIVRGVSQVDMEIHAESVKIEADGKIGSLYSEDATLIAVFAMAEHVAIYRKDLLT